MQNVTFMSIRFQGDTVICFSEGLEAWLSAYIEGCDFT